MPKRITPADSRYIPLTQQPYCCVPTCIQMIMVANNIPLVPAELIGYHMGLVVPKSDRRLFYSSREGSKPPAGYGTQAGKKQYSPNTVFRKLSIPLTMQWSLIDGFNSYAEFHSYLVKIDEQKAHVLLCFDWPTLNGVTDQGHWGHVCVLDRIFDKGNTIRFIDPERNVPKWNSVASIDMYRAMKHHGSKKSGGFWILTPHNS